MEPKAQLAQSRGTFGIAVKEPLVFICNSLRIMPITDGEGGNFSSFKSSYSSSSVATSCVLESRTLWFIDLHSICFMKLHSGTLPQFIQLAVCSHWQGLKLRLVILPAFLPHVLICQWRRRAWRCGFSGEQAHSCPLAAPLEANDAKADSPLTIPVRALSLKWSRQSEALDKGQHSRK